MQQLLYLLAAASNSGKSLHKFEGIQVNINNYKMNEYRFYHCYQKPSSIVCRPVDKENILPSEPNSRLLVVPKYIPEVLDTLVLNYKYYQNVKIIKKSNE